jgi:hypothetical protein
MQGVDLILLFIFIGLLIVYMITGSNITQALILAVGYVSYNIYNKAKFAKGVDDGNIIIKP